MPLLAALALLTLTPDDIMTRTIAATRQDTAAWHERITLLKHRTIEKTGEPKTAWDFLVYGVDGHTVEQLKRRDGVSLPNEPAEPVVVDILRIITERATCYTFAFAKARTGIANGRPVYILTFTPRATLCSFNGDEEHIAILTAGTVWIDRERFCIWKLEGKLSKPITKKFIVSLGSISFCSIEFEQTIVGELVIPLRLKTVATYGFFLKKIKTVEQRIVTYDTPAPRAP